MKSGKSKQGIFYFLALLLPLFLILIQTPHVMAEKNKILNLGFILDFKPEESPAFIEFIEDLPHIDKYNFIIYEWRLLENSTFVKFLMSRGEILPFFSYPQLKPPRERMEYLDHYLHEFKRMVGVYPNGSFMFQPDTFSVEYMRGKYGMRYVAGYCFDQLLVDYMSMVGGWQAPYYSNTSNVLVPSRSGRGLIIFPHTTWDWIGRYRDHHYNMHPQNAYLAFEKDEQKALDYMKRLALETLDSLEPFGYIAVTFEFKALITNYGILDMTREYCRWLVSESKAIPMTFSNAADWFMGAYPSNPEYRITFTSPSTAQTVTWIFNEYMRIAVIDGKVVNFIDYRKQPPDPFLRVAARIDPSRPSSKTNVIDTSLRAEIDLLIETPPSTLQPTGTFLLFYLLCIVSLMGLRFYLAKRQTRLT